MFSTQIIESVTSSDIQAQISTTIANQRNPLTFVVGVQLWQDNQGEIMLWRWNTVWQIVEVILKNGQNELQQSCISTTNVSHAQLQ